MSFLRFCRPAYFPDRIWASYGSQLTLLKVNKMTKNSYNTLFVLSFILSVLIVFVSSYGLFTAGFYHSESENWQQQCYGQDLIDLVIVAPALIVATLLIRFGNRAGLLAWPGIMIYLAYTFLIYCFDVHFNGLFVEYCLILGLSVYGLVYFLYKQITASEVPVMPGTGASGFIAIFLAATGIVFYFLWLAEIIPAIRAGSTPETVVNSGLPTNPVHVIDLALILPLFIIAGVLLFRKNRLGYILSPLLLVFSALMDITIAVLNFMMKQSLLLTIIFLILGIFTAVLFFVFVKRRPTHM